MLFLALSFYINENNQQPYLKGTRYVDLIRYLYSGFHTSFMHPKAPSHSEFLGTNPLKTNKKH